MARRETLVAGEEFKDGQSKSLSEIGTLPPIEQVTENDFVKAAELEKFMNEVCTLVVHQTDKEGELDIICPQVNGVNQPIVRGEPMKVKRKYIEVLARCMVTKQEQKRQDMNDLSSLRMTGKSVQSYPFSVIHDPNPTGPEWLKAIVRSAAADAAR